MARNEEKQYGKLNRLYLLKEKEEYEKANPNRPRLDTLYTAEEVQKWLPSIKKDLDFYLKKSQVTCYSDAHVEECKNKVIKLEKEFKAFVRKIKQLSSSTLDVIPWTNRPYKRKKPIDSSEDGSSKEFKRIPIPILDNEIPDSNEIAFEFGVDCNLMNQPLSFSTTSNKDEQTTKQTDTSCDIRFFCMCESKLRSCDHSQHCLTQTKNICIKNNSEHKVIQPKQCNNIVNYDSSDSEYLWHCSIMHKLASHLMLKM